MTLRFFAVLLTLTFGLSAFAEDDSQLYDDNIPLKEAKCLVPGANALLGWISDQEPGSDYHLFYDRDQIPSEIKDIAGDSAYELFGVWRLENDQEFIQYGDHHSVIMVTMKWDGHTCSVVGFDSGQNDWD